MNPLLERLGKEAKEAAAVLSSLSAERKNEVLRSAADALRSRSGEILSANAEDMAAGREKGMPEGLLDRLLLTEGRIGAMAEGIDTVALLPDPVGEVTREYVNADGLLIRRVRTPLGVVGIIYEARPNVTADVFALCFKTGNALIARGGRDALRSNMAITGILRDVLASHGLPAGAIAQLEDTSRETAAEFMRMRGVLDVLIPRGGAGLIRSALENASVPVIETGTGNCHIYVAEDADIPMAVRIVENAKTQRIGVCNAAESLVVHSGILQDFLPALYERIGTRVAFRADERSAPYLPGCAEATEEDFGTEYLDYILSVKTVDSLDEAIRHINRYSTKHSESIITEDPEKAERFLREIDSAAVYHNASTRFTDGFVFGLGAEIGISTQKLHARGPMGLEALTSEKYVIEGNGQIRK